MKIGLIKIYDGDYLSFLGTNNTAPCNTLDTEISVVDAVASGATRQVTWTKTTAKLNNQLPSGLFCFGVLKFRTLKSGTAHVTMVLTAATQVVGPQPLTLAINSIGGSALITIAGSATPTLTPTPTTTRTPTPTPTVTLTPTPTTIPLSPACPVGVPPRGVGNANCDAVVDLLDFEIWRQEFLGIENPATRRADFNSINPVNVLDFEIWRRTFTSGYVASTPTPTPTSGPSAYRVFMTSATYTGNLGSMSGANAKCQQLANASSYTNGGIFKAWISYVDQGTYVRYNATDNIRPNVQKAYTLLNGTQIASGINFFNIEQNLGSAINRDEHNVVVSDPGGVLRVWTGTGSTGTFANWDCNGWTQGTWSAVEGVAGSMVNSSPAWTNTNHIGCTTSAHLYCFETDQGASTPTPTRTPTPTITLTPTLTPTGTVPACSSCGLLDAAPNCKLLMCPNGAGTNPGVRTSCTIGGQTNANCYAGCCGGVDPGLQ